MKTSLVFLLLICSIDPASAQKFALDVSGGYGALRSGAGGIVTIYNFLFVGYGSFKGFSSPSLGLVYRSNVKEIEESGKMVPTAYAAFAVGLIGSASESRSRLIIPTSYYESPYYINESDKQSVVGYAVLAGYNFPLGSNLYIEGGIGYAWGSTKLFESTGVVDEQKLGFATFDVGIGVKIF